MGDSSMTDDSMLDTVRQAQAASRTRAMSRDEKLGFLKSNGWRRAHGNHWQSRDGITTSFANAVRLQVLADIEEA
jgi:hypothetical protein